MISSSLRHTVHVLLAISKPLLHFYKCGSLVLTWLCKLRASTPQWHKASSLAGKKQKTKNKTWRRLCFWCSVATASHYFYSWFRYLLLHDRISVIWRSAIWQTVEWLNSLYRPMGADCFQIKCTRNQLIGIIVVAIDWHARLQCFLSQSAPKKIHYGGM